MVYHSPGKRELQLEDRTADIEVVNFRLSPKSKPNQHLFMILLFAFLWRLIPIGFIRNTIENWFPAINRIRKADFVGDVCGGDSFSDIYGLKRILTGQSLSFITLLLKKKLVFLPQTYGPFESATAKRVAGYLLRRADKVYSRDQEGMKVVQSFFTNQNGSQHPVLFCPDVAFTLPPIAPEKIEIDPPLNPDSTEPLIGINISGLLYMGGYTGKNEFGLSFDYKTFTHDLIETLLAETNSPILIIPHSFGEIKESDFSACLNAWEKYQAESNGRLNLVRGDYNQSEIKFIIGKCDFLIGARMHACIAGLSQSIPSIGLAYSRKFIGVFESVGAGELVLDARNHSAEELKTAFMAHLKNREQSTAHLKEKIPKIKQEIRGTFSKLLQEENVS